MTAKPQTSKHLKRAWAVICCACLGFILKPSFAVADPGLQTLTYDVWTGGFSAVRANLEMDFRAPGRYDMMLAAETRGLLGKLVPWKGTFESHGWLEKGGLYKPELHKSTDSWRGDQEVKEYNYSRAGGFLNLMETDDDTGEMVEKKVDPAITQGTTDAFSAALEVLDRVARGEACEGSSKVFDGKRRFIQIFRSEGTEELKKTRYNIYEGAASKCTVEIVPDGGEWSKKPRGWLSIQEQGRERGTMPTVWVAQLEEGAPAVPVKIQVKTGYGTLFMHLASYKDQSQSLVAEKRAD